VNDLIRNPIYTTDERKQTMGTDEKDTSKWEGQTAGKPFKGELTLTKEQIFACLRKFVENCRPDQVATADIMELKTLTEDLAKVAATLTFTVKRKVTGVDAVCEVLRNGKLLCVCGGLAAEQNANDIADTMNTFG